MLASIERFESGEISFLTDFLATVQTAEAKEHLDLKDLNPEKGIYVNVLNSGKAFNAFVDCCKTYLSIEGNDSFENRLRCVLLFSDLFLWNFSNETLFALQQNPDFSKVKLGKRFIEIMDLLVFPFIKELDMDSPIEVENPDKNIQNKREVYAYFSDRFIINIPSYVGIFSYDKNDAIPDELKIKILTKNDTNKLPYNCFTNKFNCFIIGVDYYKFYIPIPSNQDVSIVGQYKATSVCFNFFKRMFWKLQDKSIWNINSYHGLIDFIIFFLEERNRFISKNPSHELEKYIILISILGKIDADKNYGCIKSKEGIWIQDYFLPDIYSWTSFDERYSIILKINQLYNDTENSWKPIDDIKKEVHA